MFILQFPTLLGPDDEPIVLYTGVGIVNELFFSLTGIDAIDAHVRKAVNELLAPPLITDPITRPIKNNLFFLYFKIVSSALKIFDEVQFQSSGIFRSPSCYTKKCSVLRC